MSSSGQFRPSGNWRRPNGEGRSLSRSQAGYDCSASEAPLGKHRLDVGHQATELSEGVESERRKPAAREFVTGDQRRAIVMLAYEEQLSMRRIHLRLRLPESVITRVIVEEARRREIRALNVGYLQGVSGAPKPTGPGEVAEMPIRKVA